MLLLVSFYFLDVRFFVTRPLGDETRCDWLKPQWLWGTRGFPQVGRLGFGMPIPGRPRGLPDLRQHACVAAGMVLQTQRELDEKRIIHRAAFDDFIICNREIVADEWGQIRFDLLIRPARGGTVQAILQRLFQQDMFAPLRDAGRRLRLLDAPALIADVYEGESIKTCKGYRDPRVSAEVATAAAGSVFVACDTPQVVVIDSDGELPPATAPPILNTDPAPTRVTLSSVTIDGTDLLVWHLVPAPDTRRQAVREEAAWASAFGLAWLVGHLHELTVVRARVHEYEQGGRAILGDLARAFIRNRNNIFAPRVFAGWPTQPILAAAMSRLWQGRAEAEARLRDIRSFALDVREEGGITGNIVQVINLAGQVAIGDGNQQSNEGTMSSTQSSGDTFNLSGNFSGAILNIKSDLDHATQSIGALPGAGQAHREELTKLVAQLQAALTTVPPAQLDLAQAVSAKTKEVVDTAKAEKPNPTLLKIALDGLKTVASTLADAVPSVVSIAGSIVSVIAKLHGL